MYTIPRGEACPRRDCLSQQRCLHNPCEADFGSGWVEIDGCRVAYEFDKDFGHVRCWSPDALDITSTGVTKDQAIIEFCDRLRWSWNKTRLNRIRCMLEELCDKQLRTSYPFIDLRGERNFRSEVYAALNELERRIGNEPKVSRTSAGSKVLSLPEAKSKETFRQRCTRWLRRVADFL